MLLVLLKPLVSRIGFNEGVLEIQLVFEKMVLKGPIAHDTLIMITTNYKL